MVAGTAAIIRRQRRADHLAARIGLAPQQRIGGQQHAGGTEAALHGVADMERRLQLDQRAGFRQAFDGLDVGAIELGREDQAATDDFAVDPNGADAAGAVLARPVGAGQAKLVAQEVDQIETRLDAALDRRAIDRQANGDRLAHAARAITAAQARRNNAPARCRFMAALALKSATGVTSWSSAAIAASSEVGSAAEAVLASTARISVPKNTSRASAIRPCCKAAQPASPAIA